MIVIIEIRNDSETVTIKPPKRKRKRTPDRQIDDIFFEVFNLYPHIHPYYRVED
jgi:hypothetical protein